MLPTELADILRLYARRGLDDWAQTPQELKTRASKCLGAAIAENEAEANVAIATVYNQGNAARMRFIPMPKLSRGAGIDRCFFLPICEVGADGKVSVALDLFLLVNSKNCLAFRFEQPSRGRHDYGHVQMSRQLLRKTIQPSILSWIPDGYPAFPLATTDPLRMFLSMATALHGNTGGFLQIVQEVFTAASRPKDAAMYLNEIKALLN